MGVMGVGVLSPPPASTTTTTTTFRTLGRGASSALLATPGPSSSSSSEGLVFSSNPLRATRSLSRANVDRNPLSYKEPSGGMGGGNGGERLNPLKSPSLIFTVNPLLANKK